MKKFFISILFIGAFGGYVAYSRSTAALPVTIQPSNITVTTDTGTTAAAGGSPPSRTTTTSSSGSTATSAASTGQYKDGTYIGAAADAYYGYMQVKVTISGGKITDVAFLQYPNDRGESRAINAQAMPILRTEALQAQSANVSGVSGASASSAAFKQTLQSALSQA